MQSENVYIGDDKFQKFLDHYQCPTPLSMVKLRFAGAICSPNTNLRPTDVISSLFDEDKQPRLETKAEAELFFKFFMGLWDEMFITIRTNTLSFLSFNFDKNSIDDVYRFCITRYEDLEFGFLEGFWGGCKTLNIPQFAAELTTSLSELAEVYNVLAKKLTKDNDDIKNIIKVVKNTDEMVEKTWKFLIEHLVLPNISKLEKTVN